MSIPYVIKPKKNPITKAVRYYPQIAHVRPVTLATIATRIEKRSTVASSDCKAVLDALQFEIKEALASGNSVRLGDLGSFRPTISGKPADTEKDVKATNVEKLNVRFTPGAWLRKNFRIGADGIEIYKFNGEEEADDDGE